MELTPQEEELIRRQREQRAVNRAGAFGPAPKPGTPETKLLADLDALNEFRLSAGYGQLPRDLDEATVKAVRAAMSAATSAKDEFGVARPFFLPPAIALEIVRALRGEKPRTPVAGGMPVPDR